MPMLRHSRVHINNTSENNYTTLYTRAMTYRTGTHSSSSAICRTVSRARLSAVRSEDTAKLRWEIKRWIT